MKMPKTTAYKKLNSLDFCLDNGGSFLASLKSLLCSESFKYVVCVFPYRKETLAYHTYCTIWSSILLGMKY